jgi:2-phosphosulfolactate phosphatase
MTINLHIWQGHEPQLRAADLYIVIDVIRAFTTTQIAFERGASQVLLAGRVDEAFALKRAHPDFLLAGERDALKIEGFDLGNSPHACSRIDFRGRGMILTTTNGVRATLHALQFAQKYAVDQPSPVLVTGYGNAEASAIYARELLSAQSASRIDIIASHPTGDDDLACAEFIRDCILQTEFIDHAQISRRIRACQSAQKFLDPARPHYDPRDVEFCAASRPHNFAMLAVEQESGPVVLPRPLAPR